MATLMDGYRGGTLRVIEALQRIQDDPETLAQERRQYSDSPPPYPSGETTKPPSPALPLSAADRRIQRQHDLLQSVPYWQYMHQCRREEDRIIQQIERRRERRKETLPYNRKLGYSTNAESNIKNNWIEQRIWNDKWTGYPLGRWKHEEPLTDETEPPKQDPVILGLFRPASGHRQPSKQPKIRGKQLAVREREAAASRPLPQFQYQLSKEREWLEDDFWHQELAELVDFDAMAYENVKKSWIEQKIWNPRWDEDPGMAWMHEEPDEDDLDIPASPEAVSREERDVAESAEQAIRPRPVPGVSGLAPSLGSDGDGADGHTSAALRGRGLPPRLDQHEAASSPAYVDVVSQTLTEPAARILRKVRSSRVKKRGRTKRLNRVSSPTAVSDDFVGVKGEFVPTIDMPTAPEVDALTAEAPLGASKRIRRKRALEKCLDGQERPSLLRRRSARIEGRSGTSKCTIYDKHASRASEEGNHRAQQPSSRPRRRVNPTTSADSRTPRGVMKNRSRRQVTQLSERGNTQPDPRQRSRRRRRQK